MTRKTCYLVADIGGTNVRSVLVDPLSKRVLARDNILVEAYPDINQAMEYILQKNAGEYSVAAALLAVACPVQDDQVSLTNSPWQFSRRAMQARFGWRHLFVLNDFEAAAYGVIALPPGSFQQIGASGVAPDQHCKAVIGPGTGFGLAALVRCGTQWTVVPAEGGHARFAPGTAEEIQVLQVLARSSGTVYREDILSGKGLSKLYRALAEVRGLDSADKTPASITEAALLGSDALSVDVLTLFCSILGAAAADIALDLGARGGVYIAGGIVRRFTTFLEASPFRSRFESHTRMHSYLRNIPTFMVTEQDIGLRGAQTAMAMLLE